MEKKLYFLAISLQDIFTGYCLDKGYREEKANM